MPLHQKSANGIVYIALYVDYDLMVQDIAAIDDAISALKNNGMVLKIMDGLQDNFLPNKFLRG